MMLMVAKVCKETDIFTCILTTKITRYLRTLQRKSKTDQLIALRGTDEKKEIRQMIPTPALV